MTRHLDRDDITEIFRPLILRISMIPMAAADTVPLQVPLGELRALAAYHAALQKEWALDDAAREYEAARHLRGADANRAAKRYVNLVKEILGMPADK